MIDFEHPASFRDPSGFLFRDEDGTLYRQVNRCYESDYKALMASGLYKQLTSQGLLVEHEEVKDKQSSDPRALVIIRPRYIRFQSYPYEWAFSALKDAGLLTLEIERRSLKAGISLKDASAYNVCFDGYRPVFIDTLSFERHEDGDPWQAYGQFCRHFLAPLAIMANTDVSLGRMLALHLDGIPLDLASRLLPMRTWLRPGLLMHLHIHARMVQRYAATGPGSQGQTPKRRVSRANLLALIDSLRRTLDGQRWCPRGTEWADYYSTNSYEAEAFDAKKSVVARGLQLLRPASVWDLGANTGVFSRLATELGAYTYAIDSDPGCVELNYLQSRRERNERLVSLLIDLSNPSPSIGWANMERGSLLERGPADTVLALALVHHLCISNNTPLPRVAELLRRLGRSAIVEFVPKSDPQTQRLLRSRKDIFAEYHEPAFEEAFRSRFSIVETVPVPKTGRRIYFMKAV